jgi:hypothetical protein
VPLVSLSRAIGDTQQPHAHLTGDDLVFASDGWYETVVDTRTGHTFTYYAGPDAGLVGEGGEAFEQIHQLLRDDE